jgi:plastocyanin
MSLRASALLATLVPALFVGGVAIAAVGCEFIASADRSKIPQDDAGLGGSISTGAQGGTSTGATGGTGQGGTAGSGGVGPCAASTDCEGTDSACQKRDCTDGMCSMVNEPSGTPLPARDQIPLDCQTLVCDGRGDQIAEADVSDLPDDDNDCTDDTCDGATATHTPKASGVSCADAGGTVCDGAGACVECVDSDDCTGSDVCDNNECVPLPCADGAENGMETDIDCGGPDCAPCADGEMCMLASDCLSSVCTNMLCAAPTCTDTQENGTETDVDCGGSCAMNCAFDKKCLVAADCIGGSCIGMKCAATCTDTAKNGSETDVDCGGTCGGCATNEACVANADCASKICQSMLCVGPSCSDDVMNGTETGVDCGGGCGACDDADCTMDADCASNICEAGKCGLNGCSLADAVDITATPTVTFASFSYSPPCFKVTAGTTVTFMGDFAPHPLVGGRIVGTTAEPQGAPNPFGVTSSGTSASFVLGTAGEFGFYCQAHAVSNGMKGAAFVVP